MVKKVLKSIAFYSGISIFFFILNLFFSLSLIDIFYKFGLIDIILEMILVLVYSGLMTLLFDGFIALSIKTDSEKIAKISRSIYHFSPKIILGYVLLCLFLNSIKAKLFITIDSAKDFLGLQWTIFAISIGIFLFWHAILSQKMKERKSKEVDNLKGFKRYAALLDRDNDYLTVSSNFISLTILLLNLLLLVCNSAMIYINESINIVSQSLLISCFYLSTNSIVSIFLDIIKPLMAKKKEYIKQYKISEAELKQTYNEVIVEELLLCLSNDIKDKSTEEQLIFWEFAKNFFHDITTKGETSDSKNQGKMACESDASALNESAKTSILGKDAPIESKERSEGT